MNNNRVCNLLGIKYPIIQAGMVWCSGWKMASEVSNVGGLGVIGAGSMSVEVLEEHITKCKAATSNPFAVNLPLLYRHVNDQIEILNKHKVPIVITSAGNPDLYTDTFKRNGIIVMHVVSSAKFALKAQNSGVDAIIAEGVEAGGHNGKEEITTLCLVPSVVNAVEVPVIAAGGIASGKAMAAVFALGAEGVQVGSRFAVSKESSAHELFKQAVIASKEGETKLLLKKITPVRMLVNDFAREIIELENKGADANMLKEFLGSGRSKIGIFEGNLRDGELEIGQIASQLNKLEPSKEIVLNIWEEFQRTCQKLSTAV